MIRHRSGASTRFFRFNWTRHGRIPIEVVYEAYTTADGQTYRRARRYRFLLEGRSPMHFTYGLWGTATRRSPLLQDLNLNTGMPAGTFEEIERLPRLSDSGDLPMGRILPRGEFG